ncbi:MAG TPA: DUF58 domain-containing protein [Mariprofundaceae bacterium]|nr:DUF58 domain-containing protein [Mariprofundaceae bacterium]
MKRFLEVHKEFLPDRLELSRLEAQAAHIRASRHGRTVESAPNETHSHFLGRGLDFEEVRAYAPGDDMRAMDWRVTARTGKPHIKVYREERQRVMVLVIDVASSMLFGSSTTTKLAQAVRAAALFAFSMLQHRDRMSVLLIGEYGGFEVPPCQPYEALWRTIDFLSSGKDGRGGGMSWGGLLATMPRGRIVTLISDFLHWEEHDWKALSQTASRHYPAAIQIYDPVECAMPDIGLARVSGLGGEAFMIDTGRRRAREAYAACWDAHQTALLRRFSSASVPYWSVSTTDDPSADIGQMVNILRR